MRFDTSRTRRKEDYGKNNLFNSKAPPFKRSDIGFPVFEEDPEKSPLNFAFCWYNRDNEEERTSWIKPCYVEDEIVAIAQTYKDAGFKEDDVLPCGTARMPDFIATERSKGWSNKMLVSPALMPHQIKITKVSLSSFHDVLDVDCFAEGIVKGKCGSENTHFMDAYYVPNDPQPYCTPQIAFSVLVDRIYGKGTWERNPWTFAYTFELVK